MAEATVDTKAENSDITYIKLPGAKNTSLWEYFGFKSKDGKSIWKEGKEKPNAYCLVAGCSKAAMTYYGNTTNIVRHLQTLQNSVSATDGCRAQDPGGPSYQCPE